MRAANRFIVHRSVVDEFRRRVTEQVKGFTVGHGTEPGVTIGPLIDGDAAAKAEALVPDATTRGATITTGGKRLDGPGTFFAPTVLANVVAGSNILREEIFGPVLAVASFNTEDEAVELANDAEYGLVAHVYTEDLRRGQRMIERIQIGMVGLTSEWSRTPLRPLVAGSSPVSGERAAQKASTSICRRSTP